MEKLCCFCWGEIEFFGKMCVLQRWHMAYEGVVNLICVCIVYRDFFQSYISILKKKNNFKHFSLGKNSFKKTSIEGEYKKTSRD